MASYDINVYSHNFSVGINTLNEKSVMMEFCKGVGQSQLVYVGRGKYKPSYVKYFAAAYVNRRVFRFHIHQLQEFIRFVGNRGYGSDDLKITHHPLPDISDVKLKVVKSFSVRDKQIPLVEYMTSDLPLKVVNAQTGFGKTVCAGFTMQHYGLRTAIIVQGMYIDKWVSDVKNILGLKTKDILVVRGSKNLINLIRLGLDGDIVAKVIIISNTTFANYLKDHERSSGKSMIYHGCHPIDFFKTVGVGLRLVDEVHLNFHLNFKIDLYTHVKTAVDMSATIEADDPFIRRMYLIKYPESLRFRNIVYDKYISVKALMYSAYNTELLSFIRRGRNSYSHVEFEQSIMERKMVLRKYLEIILSVYKERFVNKAVKGQKMLIFAETVEMCKHIANYIAPFAPQFKVGIYISETDYDEILNNDVSVTTIKSAGTALDIPGLRVCLMTNALGARQANEQALGRLRRLKDWPEITPEFFYLVCVDIEKHMEYHERKQEYFRDKVLEHKEEFLRFVLT